MTAPAAPEGPSLAGRFAVGAAAALFVGSIAWQVIAQRDDWPLSCFPMYSGLEGSLSSRSVIKGVSDQGEFDLRGEMLPFGGSRLRHLNGKLLRDPARQQQFVRLVQQRYEAQPEAQRWPVLQAIRSYSESWVVQPRLAGIDKPKPRANGSLYICPRGLLDRLAQERSGQAPAAAPRQLPAGDRVADFGADGCGPGCESILDRYAADGRALQLTAQPDQLSSASTAITLNKGSWSLFLRMRSTASLDHVRVSLDGSRLGGTAELGNYAASLGAGVWVWTSASPGKRPFQVEIEQSGTHTFSVTIPHGTLQIDQLWLSQIQPELPIFNEPIAP